MDTPNELPPAVAAAEPGKHSNGKWLDLDAIRHDLNVASRLAWSYKLNLSEYHAAGRYDQAATVSENLRALKEHVTRLCSLRALHRGKRHVTRHRIFGSGLPNGTMIVEGPVAIPDRFFERYAWPKKDV